MNMIKDEGHVIRHPTPEIPSMASPVMMERIVQMLINNNPATVAGYINHEGEVVADIGDHHR